MLQSANISSSFKNVKHNPYTLDTKLVHVQEISSNIIFCQVLVLLYRYRIDHKYTIILYFLLLSSTSGVG